MSPFICILCAEAITQLALKEEQSGIFHGVQVARNAPLVTHLMFANDLVFFTQSNIREIRVVERNLTEVLDLVGAEDKSTKVLYCV